MRKTRDAVSDMHMCILPSLVVRSSLGGSVQPHILKGIFFCNKLIAEITVARGKSKRLLSIIARCKFVYRCPRGTYSIDDQCTENADFKHNTLCKRHYNKGPYLNLTPVVTEGHHDDPADTTAKSVFPRMLTNAEVRECVNEARDRTSPKLVMMRVCAICGRVQMMKDLIYWTVREVLEVKDMLQSSNNYSRVPSQHFTYDGVHQELDGLVIDRRGFLDVDEVMEGAPLMVRLCKPCDSSLAKHKVPDLALANVLWTGVGDVPELSGLSWIEEKLIARCHVSIQMQKCREVK